MKLRVRAFGLSVGTILGLGLFAATLISLWAGEGQTISKLMTYFTPGFGRSFLGAFMGLVWGFVYGFIAGSVCAWLYNIYHKALYKS